MLSLSIDCGAYRLEQKFCKEKLWRMGHGWNFGEQNFDEQNFDEQNFDELIADFIGEILREKD